MVNRALINSLILLSVTAVAVAGCGNPNAIPQHSADDQKAIDQVNKMTPQQRIDMIQKGPMPPAAKDQMIKKIKADNNLN
jgi:hypothetical protein